MNTLHRTTTLQQNHHTTGMSNKQMTMIISKEAVLT